MRRKGRETEALRGAPADGAAHAAELVLVGGGHTHVQVLRKWIMRPLPGVRLSVVLDRPEAIYSGMVPGFVAGMYRAAELEIDVVPLARRARARVLLARALRVDPEARRIELEGRASIAYDVASLDVGSTVRGLELAGVREHALATRPIRDFVDRLDAFLARAGADAGAAPLRIVVVGAGAAGLELALTLKARLREAAREAELTLIGDSADLLPGSTARVARRARREAEHRGIRLRCAETVRAVEKDAVLLAGAGERLACDLAVWATGAAPPALLAESPLPRDAGGFVRVRPTLQVVDRDDLFAVGDCAALDDDPWLPKAGVYAVREGPVLDHNLRALLRGGRLRDYRPQRDFLSLLNLGDGRVLGAKWGLALSGRSLWRLKDRIDRRFVRRFQVLDSDGAPARAFPAPGRMGDEEMVCGGCAAKLGASPLERALARLDAPPEDASVLLGLEQRDDAAALALPGGAVALTTIDAFRAFSDDPWLVGRVAAVNAASDIFAKGGRPRHALALVTVPEGRGSEETLYQVLAGVRAALDPLGVSLVGGHTTAGEELFVGISVSGDLAQAGDLLRRDALQPGDQLVLSKGLGTGVLLAADMRGLARGAWLEGAIASMVRQNAAALRAARDGGARACTDVSGFGLAGHLAELLGASGVSARLTLDALPALDGALALLARGLRSSFHEQNAAACSALLSTREAVSDPALGLLFDPQTSGGLLFSVSASRSADTLRALHEAGDARAAVIGEVLDSRADGALVEVLRR